MFGKYKNFLFLASLSMSSMVGSSVFVLPATLGKYGIYSMIGCLLASVGATLLALIFAALCKKFPETGGPHVYIKHIFGDFPAQIFGITYWLVSWISSSIVIITSILYLEQLLPYKNKYLTLILQLLLLLLVTIINCKSIQTSAIVEIILTVFFKFFILLIIPIITINYFDISNFKVLVTNQSTFSIINETTIMAFWGFVGVECVTTIAGTIKDSQRIFKKSIISGAVIASIIYILNYGAIQGAMPAEQLCASKAPYVDVIRNILGDNASYFISLIGSIICMGTLNAWTLASGQIATGLANDGYLPKIFNKKSKDGAPYIAIFASSICLAFILIFTLDENAMKQLESIIDYSTITFGYIYWICSLAYLKILNKSSKAHEWIIGIVAVIFCTIMSIYFSLKIFICMAVLFGAYLISKKKN